MIRCQIYSNVKIYTPSGNGQFVLANEGLNCPPSNLLRTEAECKEASIELGLSYEFRNHDEHRPVGCYWQLTQEGLIPNWVTYSFFNAILDPSHVDVHGKTGGVCKRVGMLLA